MLSGISIWQLLIVLVIVALLFGTRRLRNLGSDLGASVKGFRNAMGDDEGKKDKSLQDRSHETIDAKAEQHRDRHGETR